MHPRELASAHDRRRLAARVRVSRRRRRPVLGLPRRPDHARGIVRRIRLRAGGTVKLLPAIAVAALSVGCLPALQPSPYAPPSQVARCERDRDLHAAGVLTAATGGASSLGFAWASLESPNTGTTARTFADVGLASGALGLAAVAVIALGAEMYAGDGCVGATGPLPVAGPKP